MSYFTRYTQLVIFLTMLLAVVSCGGEESQKNLLSNGGAEEGDAANPASWYKATPPAEGLLMYRDPNIAHSGQYSLAISNTHTYEQAMHNNWAQKITNIPRGKTLRLSAYIRTENAESVNVCLKCVGNANNTLAFTSTPVYQGNRDWTQVLSEWIVIPEKTTSITVMAVLTGCGKVYFDDIALEEDPQASAVEPGDRTTPSDDKGEPNANLLRNGGAEEGDAATPASWFKACFPAEGLTMYRDPNITYSGQYSLAISNTHKYEQTVSNNWAQNITAIPRGKTLRLSAYIRTENAENVNVCLQCVGDANKILAFASTSVYQGNHDWTRVQSKWLVIPEKTTLIIVMAALTGCGKVYFDDIALEEDTQASAVESCDRTMPPAEKGGVQALPNHLYRGVVFLTSSVGTDVSSDEIERFVRECRLNYVVFDFAWITHHWPQTNFTALNQLCQHLRDSGVDTAVMYRPRVLNPSEASIHYAVINGAVASDHNTLCYAHEDSVAWGCSWGKEILSKLPAIDQIILYNLLSTCMCPKCQNGQGQAFAAGFLDRCKAEWRQICPSVKIGHVGLDDEYESNVDFICPFLSVNASDKPFDAASATTQICGLAARHRDKRVTPLIKVCWESETRNSTGDIIEAIKQCANKDLGFILWYYEWIFQSPEKRYHPDEIMAAFGDFPANTPISEKTRAQETGANKSFSGHNSPHLTPPYSEKGYEKLPWPHQPPNITPEEAAKINREVIVINNFPLYQADEKGDLRYIHGGLDLVLDNGTKIYAMKEGWVQDISHTTITIADTAGTEPSYGWEYTHLANFQVEIGAHVKEGTYLGDICFDGLPHIHLTKVFSQGGYWGNWRYICLPDYHFNYHDQAPPVIKKPFYFFPNNSDKMILPDNAGVVTLRGQVDIVVGMRETGIYARLKDNGFGDRLGVTRIEYEISPVLGDKTAAHQFHSFDFEKMKIKEGCLNRMYKADLTKILYKHWDLFEQNKSYNQCFSYYVITNSNGQNTDYELDFRDHDYCWDTEARNAQGDPIYPDGQYQISVWAYDAMGNVAHETMTVLLANHI